MTDDDLAQQRRVSSLASSSIFRLYLQALQDVAGSVRMAAFESAVSVQRMFRNKGLGVRV